MTTRLCQHCRYKRGANYLDITLDICNILNLHKSYFRGKDKVQEKKKIYNINPLRAIDVYRRQMSRFLTITVFQLMQPELPMLFIDVKRISV